MASYCFYVHFFIAKYYANIISIINYFSWFPPSWESRFPSSLLPSLIDFLSPVFTGSYPLPPSRPHSKDVLLMDYNCFNYHPQLCRGGSVTNLVKSLRKKGKYLEEDLIAYILYETLKVYMYVCCDSLRVGSQN